MPSLDASGIPVVSKQLVSHRSQGRNLAVTLNQSTVGQDSVRQPIVQGIPAYARASGLFGTQTTPVVDSFLHLGRMIKQAESVDDTTVARVLGQVPAATGLVTNQQWQNHQGGRIVSQESIDDQILARERNDSVRPGGEI